MTAIRIRPCCLNEVFEIVRFKVIIAVAKCDIFSLRRIDSCISRRRHTAIRFVDHLNAGILGSQFVTKFSTSIRGAVVNKNQLKISVGLPLN